MPDKEHDGLERELGELGSRIEYPPTPDVARAVRRRLDAQRPEQQRARSRFRSRLRGFAKPKWAAAATAFVLLSLTILSPATRSTVSDSASSLGTLGDAGRAAGGAAGGSGAGASGASEAQYAEGATTTQHGQMAASDGASAAASSGSSSLPARPPGAALGLGEELSESEVRARVEGLLLPETPELTGERGVIYAGGPSEDDGVVLVFGPEPGLPPLGGTGVGLLLAEVPGDLDSAYFAAGLASELQPEEVDVDGGRGYWLPDGRALSPQPGEAESLPGGALLWERGDVALLMRVGVPEGEAIRIAESIR